MQTDEIRILNNFKLNIYKQQTVELEFKLNLIEILRLMLSHIEKSKKQMKTMDYTHTHITLKMK